LSIDGFLLAPRWGGALVSSCPLEINVLRGGERAKGAQTTIRFFVGSFGIAILVASSLCQCAITSTTLLALILTVANQMGD
jgi:hypothetical protein